MNWIEWVLIFIHFILASTAAGHALIYKRDSRAAFGWVAVCVVFPLFGPLLYFLFGINRIRTRAKKLHGRPRFKLGMGFERSEDSISDIGPISDVPSKYSRFARISNKVSHRPITFGNRLRILNNGEQAYPAMLLAIEESRHLVYLSTYIFETNPVGRRFINALAAAAKRGVDVRVIIDGMGEKYSLPWAGTLLAQAGVRIARFLPPQLWPPQMHINLRNHRKILVVDALTGFTGGMNIGGRHMVSNVNRRKRVADVHFCIEGPIVAQLQQIFLENWEFVTDDSPSAAPDTLTGDKGPAICRAIVNGPDEDIDKLAAILAGAVSAAKRSVLIMTPYFLPSREMIGAMQAAALRGVDVAVVLPAKSNLPFVHWATQNMLWELLQYQIQVWYQPPPFNHTKLFVVDDCYTHIGSANLDPRSLRLNFELAVEVMDSAFAHKIAGHIHNTIQRSRQVTLEEVDGRSFSVRLRDAFSWLFSPYL